MKHQTVPPDIEWPSEAALECPFPLYEKLRGEPGIYELPPGRFALSHLSGRRTFLASRWEDIVTIAQQPERFEVTHDPYYDVDVNVGFPTVCKYSPASSPHSNGADHKIKRGWSMRLAEPERLRNWEPKVRAICEGLVEEFAGSGECEFRWDFAEKLPMYFICDLLGLPRGDAVLFQKQADKKMEKYLDSALSGTVNTEKEIPPLHAYMLDSLRGRLTSRTDDLLSELMYDQIDRDGGVDINFQIGQAINLVLAGAETTAHLLTNMMFALCEEPGLMQRVVSDRALLPMFLEETMRLQSPLQWLARVCVEDTVVSGTLIPKGSIVVLFWGSGNRDPERFEEPDEIRLDRKDVAKNQLGFGRGAHLCAGAALARLEGRCAFETLLQRLTSFRIDRARSVLANVRTHHGRSCQKLVITFERRPAP